MVELILPVVRKSVVYSVQHLLSTADAAAAATIRKSVFTGTSAADFISAACSLERCLQELDISVVADRRFTITRMQQPPACVMKYFSRTGFSVLLVFPAIDQQL
jgi:hypothetical protein